MKKHFIIVGAQRSGTTYLYNLLEEHPEVCMAKPVRPEPKFFIHKESQDINLEEYQRSFFYHCQDQIKLFGEKSTSYYESESSAKLIAKSLPDVKLIFCLRNPVQRALSNYFFSVNNGIEDRSLKEVFLDEKDPPSLNFNTSVNPFDYLGRGEYAKYISMYLGYFPRKQVKVLIFEEFVNNVVQIKDLFSFLKVNQNFTPDCIGSVLNESLKNSSVPNEVLSYLTSYYKPFINDIEALLNREILAWK